MFVLACGWMPIIVLLVWLVVSFIQIRAMRDNQFEHQMSRITEMERRQKIIIRHQMLLLKKAGLESPWAATQP